MEKRLVVKDLNKNNVHRLSKEFPVAAYDRVYVYSNEGLKLPEYYNNVNYINDLREVENLENLQWYLEENENVIGSDAVIKGGGVKFDELNVEYSKYQFGSLNKEKTFCVFIPEEKNGLFYFINYYIRLLKFCEDRNLIPIVDMKNFRSIYISDEEIGVINAWERYFEQFSDASLEEVYNSTNVIIASFNMNSISYRGFTNEERVRIYNTYFKLKKRLKNAVENEQERIFEGKGRVLGVLCRGTDYANAAHPYAHAIPYDAYETAIVAQKKMLESGYEYIYLSTEDQTVLEHFQTVFGKRLLYTNQKRVSEIGNMKIGSFMKANAGNELEAEYKRGEDYFITIYLLAQCESLMATHCAGTRGALVINGLKYKNLTILNKGLYGMNGDNPLIIESTNKNLISCRMNNKILENGINVENVPNGKLHIWGKSTKKCSLMIKKKELCPLDAGVKYTCAIKGFENYSLEEAHFTFRTYNQEKDGNLENLKFWCKDGEVYQYTSNPVWYDLYVVIEEGVEIDEIISFQIEENNVATHYVESHTCITEIALKDEMGTFYELEEGDYVDIQHGILFKNNRIVPLDYREKIKLKNLILLEGGVKVKYKGKYLPLRIPIE